GRLCYAYIPARYVFLFLASCGLFLVYAFKGFLGVAIVAMVRHKNTSTAIDNECPAEDNYQNSGHNSGEFNWDDKQQALLLGSFFYGYVITQIPAGIAVERFGAKWMFGFSLLISGILSLLGPMCARWGQDSIVPFFITRLGQGLAQGVILPSMNSMIAQWMPKMERSRAMSIIFAGSSLGSVVSLPLTGYLCDEPFLDGWPTIFYVLGISACIWFIFWSVFVFDSPDSHPFISQYEYDLISEGQGEEKLSSKRKIPWKPMLTSYRVYASTVTHFGFNWGYLTLLTLLPTYFTNILHMNIKTVYNFAFFGTGICLIGVVLSKCDKTLSIVFFVIGLGLNGSCYSGFLANYVDMAPDFAGILMGVTNAVGNVPGFIAPQTASLIYSNGQTLNSWSHVFYTCSAIYFFTGIVYILFSTSELQTWGLAKKDDKANDNTIEKS
ncbi:unnamed protein product, partial [Medioppia subpectinata]